LEPPAQFSAGPHNHKLKHQLPKGGE
jgi:hypothetical protein